MGTSKSSKRTGEWTGGALLFSGRPDPTWIVGRRNFKELETLWATLSPWSGPLTSASPLGYRGCFVRCPEMREWFAYGGVVTLKTGGQPESRQDKNRNFERLVLASAPKKLLPEHLANLHQ
jgi:hypothetical protein